MRLKEEYSKNENEDELDIVAYPQWQRKERQQEIAAEGMTKTSCMKCGWQTIDTFKMGKQAFKEHSCNG